jgi:formylglycine-generating enzyme required for sulfatase activity
MTRLTWYEAAWYCNWLSEQEGLPEDQWCYVRNAQEQYGPGMSVRDNHLELVGYRLPTEAEWEYACRAGALMSRCYGQSDALLPDYAWYLGNSGEQTQPVGRLKPNDFGLFDMHGNAFEWCDNPDSILVPSAEVVPDAEWSGPVTDEVGRVLRGGSFLNSAPIVRSAQRFPNYPDNRLNEYGFRVARTWR